jgi:hypothetical protein
VEQFANSNYGNVFSFFDRILFSFTPVERGVEVQYGLDGFDDPAIQRTAGLLVLPFTEPGASRTVALVTRQPA